MMDTVLLLGGTAEARQFAEGFDRSDVRLVASLAGVTREPRAYPCETCIGGFGGVDAMARWIAENNIVAMLDATHPFATQISENAREAAARCGVPCLGLCRAPWEPSVQLQSFMEVGVLAGALPGGARVLLTTGRLGVEAFSRRKDVAFWLRTIEPMEDLPSHITPIVGRPPFSFEDELAVMRDAQISHLVTKNAGGTRPAKLQAAEQLGLPVFSVAMPPSPHERTASSVSDALAWAQGHSVFR